METKKLRTKQILTVLHILAWVAFVGFMIETGAVLFSYVASLFNPDGAKNLYQGMNLYSLKEFSVWHYTATVSFIVGLSSMKAFVAALVIKTIRKVNLENPFKIEVAQIIERISFVLFSTWCIAMMANAHTRWLVKHIGDIPVDFVSGELILTAGLVFVISQVFRRGVEIQSENELTV